MSYELRYFSGYSKGLGPALVAEFSGVPWKGNKDLSYKAAEMWGSVKPTAPFGQMPLLTTPDGNVLAQTNAIINVLAKAGGIEGEGQAYAVSQMLLCETEDIYQLMVKYLPTKTDSGMVRLPSSTWRHPCLRCSLTHASPNELSCHAALQTR